MKILRRNMKTGKESTVENENGLNVTTQLITRHTL